MCEAPLEADSCCGGDQRLLGPRSAEVHTGACPEAEHAAGDSPDFRLQAAVEAALQRRGEGRDSDSASGVRPRGL